MIFENLFIKKLIEFNKNAIKKGVYELRYDNQMLHNVTYFEELKNKKQIIISLFVIILEPFYAKLISRDRHGSSARGGGYFLGTKLFRNSGKGTKCKKIGKNLT